ncbi:MAG: Copper chaperone PCu(A)C [Actinomycetota bacterium]|jgi:periplasmic copper chaperone A
MSHRGAVFVCTALITVFAAACGADPATSGSVKPSGWARPTPTGADSGVVYVTVGSDLNAVIVSAEVTDDIADTTAVGDAVSGQTHGDGHIGHLDRPPEGPGAATPTGEPVLLNGLQNPLTEGQRFPLTITLADGTTVAVDVVVSATQPAAD